MCKEKQFVSQFGGGGLVCGELAPVALGPVVKYCITVGILGRGSKGLKGRGRGQAAI